MSTEHTFGPGIANGATETTCYESVQDGWLCTDLRCPAHGERERRRLRASSCRARGGQPCRRSQSNSEGVEDEKR